MDTLLLGREALKKDDFWETSIFRFCTARDNSRKLFLRNSYSVKLWKFSTLYRWFSVTIISSVHLQVLHHKSLQALSDSIHHQICQLWLFLQNVQYVDVQRYNPYTMLHTFEVHNFSPYVILPHFFTNGPMYIPLIKKILSSLQTWRKYYVHTLIRVCSPRCMRFLTSVMFCSNIFLRSHIGLGSRTTL